MDPTTFWNWVSVVLARFQICQSLVARAEYLEALSDFSARHALTAVGLASLSSSPSGDFTWRMGFSGSDSVKHGPKCWLSIT